MATGSDERQRLEASFRRFEELPASDAFDEKRELVRDIIADLARHAAGAAPGEHARIEESGARLQLLSPEAPDHDDVALELIDAAREHLADGHVHGSAEPGPPPEALSARGERGPESPNDAIDEASNESFPASDPPSYARDPHPGPS